MVENVILEENYREVFYFKIQGNLQCNSIILLTYLISVSAIL